MIDTLDELGINSEEVEDYTFQAYNQMSREMMMIIITLTLGPTGPRSPLSPGKPRGP